MEELIAIQLLNKQQSKVEFVQKYSTTTEEPDNEDELSPCCSALIKWHDICTQCGEHI